MVSLSIYVYIICIILNTLRSEDTVRVWTKNTCTRHSKNCIWKRLNQPKKKQFTPSLTHHLSKINTMTSAYQKLSNTLIPWSLQLLNSQPCYSLLKLFYMILILKIYHLFPSFGNRTQTLYKLVVVTALSLLMYLQLVDICLQGKFLKLKSKHFWFYDYD